MCIRDRSNGVGLVCPHPKTEDKIRSTLKKPLRKTDKFLFIISVIQKSREQNYKKIQSNNKKYCIAANGQQFFNSKWLTLAE